MGWLRTLKRVLTGEVIQKVDTEIHGGETTMSLRLKRERSSGDLYIVLAGLSGGNYQYFQFNRDEFERFVNAAEEISKSLKKPF